MFRPPRCPNPSCARHEDPEPGFFLRHGSYRPRCRARPVPRFRCRTCGRTFSRQTFRADRYDKRPHTNPRLHALLVAGTSLRECSRRLGLSLPSVECKARKLARSSRRMERLVALARGPGVRRREPEPATLAPDPRPRILPETRFAGWTDLGALPWRERRAWGLVPARASRKPTRASA